MKRVVILNDLKESDIRPENTYNEYKHILSEEIPKYFHDLSSLINIDCPGCSDNNNEHAFSSMGLDYNTCKTCGTLFVSPRPSDAQLKSFYKSSKATLFLKKNILENTAESRFKQIYSRRIQWITGLIEEFRPGAKIYLDYATRNSTFLDQLKNTGLFECMVSFLPECYEPEKMSSGNIKIIKDGHIEKDSIDIFSAFEVIERVFNPKKLFFDAFKACKKGGLFVFTAATSSGFEYQVLKKYSPNIIPTDRLNLLSFEVLVSKIKEAGFEIIETSTPGRLDVEIVRRTYEKNPDIPIDPFWKYLFRFRDENALHSLQEYLQQFQLSSHIRMAAIKR